MSNEHVSTVTITLAEYEDLIESDSMLCALIQAGVDNWEGYEVAQVIYDQENLCEDEDTEPKTFH